MKSNQTSPEAITSSPIDAIQNIRKIIEFKSILLKLTTDEITALSQEIEYIKKIELDKSEEIPEQPEFQKH